MGLKQRLENSSLVGFHPIVYTFMAGTMIGTIARSMSFPFLAIYLTTHTDLTPAVIGGIIGIGPLAGTVGGFIGGALSDFVGRRTIMLISLLINCLAFVGFSYTTNPIMLVLLSIAAGVGGSFFDPVSKALMAELTEESKRLRAFSLRYMAGNIGFAVGPALGGFAGLSGSAYTFLIAAAFYLIYAFVLSGMLARYKVKEVPKTDAPARTVNGAFRILRRDRALLFFLLGGIISYTVHGQISVSLGQYLQSAVVDGVLLFSTLLSVNALVVIVGQMPISRLMEKRSPFVGVALGSLLFGAGVVGFGYSTNWLLYILSMVVFTIGEVMVLPAEYVMLDRITPEDMRGLYYGTQSFTQLGNFLGPWLGSIVLGAYGGKTMFWMFGVLALVSIFFYWRGQLSYREREEQRHARTYAIEQ